MATKNNRKSSFANYQTSKSQYNNLNLNQNFPASNEYLSPFKSSNDKKKASVYDFAKSRQTQLWNKSTKETVLTATETCRDQRNCEIRELNISTYDLVGNGNAALTKPFVKTISGGTASAVKVNPFEFLRQQEDNVSLPETSQFKASQELLKPNPPMGGQCLSYASVPTWFPMVASYSIMFILLFIVFVAYAIDENRKKKSYYGIVDEMEEEIKDQEEAEACGAHTDGEIRVIQTTDPATSSSITKVFMVKKPLKNSLPSPSSASPISALFKRDCIFEIVEDLIGIDAVELSDSLKYQVIAVCQQLCENDLLSPKAEIELANYIMDAMKCRLEKASKKDLICYGVMVETKQILMAKSDIELPDVIAANIFTIKFREPINLILYLHQKSSKMLPKNPPKKILTESSSLESVPSIPAEISSLNESADDPSYNPKPPSKIRKMLTTAKDKVVDALKPSAKPTSSKPKATKPAKVPAKMIKDTVTKEKKEDGRIAEESFIIPIEPKAAKGKKEIQKGTQEIQSKTKQPSEKKNLLGKKHFSKADGQKDTVQKEKAVKVHVHKECTQAQNKLSTYLKAKIQLKDNVCNENLLPKVNDTITSSSHKYKVIELISKTVFGGVYKVKNIESNEFFAMKVALKPGNEELRITVNALLKIKSIHSHHFADVIDHGKNQHYNFIILTLAEKNVTKLIEEKCELSIETAVTLAKQTLLAIADFHKAGKLHRNIKNENILIGKAREYHTILLSGFGLSTNFDCDGGATTKFITRTAETQSSSAIGANKEVATEFILGSLKTGSLAGLTGQKQYRRHDFESWVYMIAAWFGATLPWGDSNDLCEVVRMKEAFLLNTGTTRREFMQQLPVEIQTIIHHIFTLKNSETVDLKWALITLDLILKVNNSPDSFMVDWDSTAAYREPPTSKQYYPPPKMKNPIIGFPKKPHILNSFIMEFLIGMVILIQQHRIVKTALNFDALLLDVAVEFMFRTTMKKK